MAIFHPVAFTFDRVHLRLHLISRRVVDHPFARILHAPSAMKLQRAARPRTGIISNVFAHAEPVSPPDFHHILQGIDSLPIRTLMQGPMFVLTQSANFTGLVLGKKVGRNTALILGRKEGMPDHSSKYEGTGGFSSDPCEDEREER